MTDTPYIEFRHVRKAFGPKVVFDDLNLTVQRGEVLAVIGGSGCGKSVMLKLLIGLLEADDGEILFEGQNVVGLSEEGLLPVRQRIAMVFQASALFDSLTVGDNIAYPLREQTRMTEAEIAARTAEVLDMVALPGTEEMMPASLSGGMRRRIGLARALAVKPECILYDEPTTGLDPLNTRRISELILRTRDRTGATSIVVTHDMASAMMVADRMAMIDERRVVRVDTAENMRAADDPRVHLFIHAMDRETVVGVEET